MCCSGFFRRELGERWGRPGIELVHESLGRTLENGTYLLAIAVAGHMCSPADNRAVCSQEAAFSRFPAAISLLARTLNSLRRERTTCFMESMTGGRIL